MFRLIFLLLMPFDLYFHNVFSLFNYCAFLKKIFFCSFEAVFSFSVFLFCSCSVIGQSVELRAAGAGDGRLGDG